MLWTHTHIYICIDTQTHTHTYFRKNLEEGILRLGEELTPHLCRSKDIEASGFNGTAAFMEVRVQSIVVEFILTHVDQLFGGDFLSG